MIVLAAAIRDCSVANSPFACRLESLLHALYVIAIVLALVLALVIFLAVKVYRKKNTDRSRVD